MTSYASHSGGHERYRAHLFLQARPDRFHRTEHCRVRRLRSGRGQRPLGSRGSSSSVFFALALLGEQRRALVELGLRVNREVWFERPSMDIFVLSHAAHAKVTCRKGKGEWSMEILDGSVMHADSGKRRVSCLEARLSVLGQSTGRKLPPVVEAQPALTPSPARAIEPREVLRVQEVLCLPQDSKSVSRRLLICISKYTSTG